MKRIKMIVLLCAALCTLTACGAQQEQTVAGTCTLSISCQTLADAPEKCKADKQELIPADGWILPEETLEFYAHPSGWKRLFAGSK